MTSPLEQTAQWAALNRATPITNGTTQSWLLHGKSEHLLDTFPPASVDLVLTDPPYFIDTLDEKWDRDKISRRQAKARTVGGLPVGMKFDPAQGQRLQAYLTPIFAQCQRILKPGGFLVSFSQARLYHRMGVAVEDAGFEIRDMLGWVYEGQAKAFSQEHFVRKMALSERKKKEIISRLAGRKTPQLKPMIEPMVFGQKPREGTFIENWLRYEVGLVDTSQTWEGRFPGNLMACGKPGKAERGAGNDHPTVKPVRVLEHIIRLLTVPGAIVVDPFAGSSSTQVAALACGRHSVGIEQDEDHIRQSLLRLGHAGDRA